MPCRPVVGSSNSMPASRTFDSSSLIISSAASSPYGRLWSAVGTMWSTVACVRSGYATSRPRSSSIPNACGLVTSWTRWRPTNNWVCPVGSSATACSSNTLSYSVPSLILLLVLLAYRLLAAALPDAVRGGFLVVRVALAHVFHLLFVVLLVVLLGGPLAAVRDDRGAALEHATDRVLGV